MLASKLNLKKGMKVRLIGKPADVRLAGVAASSAANADGVIVFARSLADLAAKAAPVVGAAKEDRIAWVVYPKGGQLGTDLNRDILWKHMVSKGIQAVRQIAIDGVWSAM